MRHSIECVDLSEHFEDCRLTAYPDPKTGGAPWTIGFGHTQGVKPGDTCTQEQADEWFDEELTACADRIFRSTTRDMQQHQLDALTSFLYNVGPGRQGVKDGLFELKSGGPSTLWKMFKAGKDDLAAREFLRWVNPGSNVEKGLKRRRVAERALFVGDDWQEVLMLHKAKGG